MQFQRNKPHSLPKGLKIENLTQNSYQEIFSDSKRLQMPESRHRSEASAPFPLSPVLLRISKKRNRFFACLRRKLC
jgi:hypothetical protein